MLQGRRNAVKEESVVQRAIQTARVDAIIAKTSREVNHRIEYVDGKVVFFEDQRGPQQSQATRTEVYLPNDVTVIVHKNIGGVGGLFALKGYYNEIEVVEDSEVIAVLWVRVNETESGSLFNPYYDFYDERGQLIGSRAYGRIDLVIASELLDTIVPGVGGNRVPESVIKWIKGKIRVEA